MRRPYVVFISHSTRDTWLANVIAERIEKIGGEAWLDDKKLSGGDVVSSSIIKALDSCDEAIVLFSPFSVLSPWVLFEAGIVYGQHKRLTPILAHVAPESIPVISGIRSVDLDELDHTYLPELTARINARDSAQG